MNTKKRTDRRKFLHAAVIVGCGTGLTGCVSPRGSENAESGGKEEVSPSEDLMREHGVLKRVLLVYREGLRRIAIREDLPPEPLADRARILRDFIQNHHEESE